MNDSILSLTQDNSNNSTSNKPQTMGSTQSTPQTQAKQFTDPRASSPSKNKQLSEHDECFATETRLQREISSLTARSQQESIKPVPSKLKSFRVKVPPSMLPGDIMTIKLKGIPTKILIATPTMSTSTPPETPSESEATKSELHTPSRATTSCCSTACSSFPSPSRMEEKVSSAGNKSVDSIFASTNHHVPAGKIIVDAKAVIVVHAVYSQEDKELKDQMIDEAMRQVVQETINSGCNSILGMTVSIKKQAENAGYLIKACGTPCLLMPAQVLLAPPTTPATGSLPIRKRTSSTEMLPIRRP